MLKEFYNDLKHCTGSGGQKGYTLVELLITIVVIATSFSAFAVALSTGALAVNEGDTEVTAQSLARSEMEYIKYLDYDQDADTYPAIDTPDSYSISVGVTGVAEPGNEKIQKVTANISKDGICVLTVEDYKVDR
jgi:prepilin-type N-terminal cleavage/methylation domain-containing protein